MKAGESAPGDSKRFAVAMADAMVHRGPDGSGVWADPHVPMALSHRRLSIIDTSNAGFQPMLSSFGRFIVSFNGEVYNFGDIRRELESSGSRFRGSSDTEVMLEAMVRWGVEAAVKKFVGMFAFALWDIKEKRLWLVRDRLGIKPLYYGMSGGNFVFASELKSVRALEFFQPRISSAAVSLFLQYGYIPAPYCIYEGMKTLPPGTILKLDAADIFLGVPSPKSYWSPLEVVRAGAADPFAGSEQEAIERLEALLMDSIKLRMISDVPLGAFLSGGIDSSLVVALMQAQSSAKIRTYTIGFREEQHDEAPWAARIAKHLGTQHAEHYFTPREAMDVIPSLAEIYDEPFADSSQLPTILVSSITRRGETVALSGDGGDELFCGYKNFKLFADEWARLTATPAPLRRMAGVALGLPGEKFYDAALPSVLSAIGRGGGSAPGAAIMRRAASLSAAGFDDFYNARYSLFHDPRLLMRKPSRPVTVASDPSRKPPVRTPSERMMYFHLSQYLTDDILAKVDRASMSVSLECRVPVLDHRVVEFAWRLPMSVKLRDGNGKWILRQILKKHVPEELFERPKMGFAVPVRDWLRGDLRPWAEDLLQQSELESGGILRASEVRRVWAAHQSGRADHSARLWRILMLQSWRRRWRV